MAYRLATALAIASTIAAQQVTYTNCYNETVATATVEYCYLSGTQTPLWTYGVAAATTPATTPASTAATTTRTGQTTAVTGCHAHETAVYCINGAGTEVLVDTTATSPLPAAYTGCHSHGSETYCLDPSGGEVVVHAEGETSHGEDGHSSEGASAGCHFHAGVEHCPGQESSCGLRERDYDVGLRVGSLFIVLATSGLGVFAPILLGKFALGHVGQFVLLLVKQFGTGIIIATAFIHLYTHADLMFSNHCLGELGYEGITAAIVIAGVFISFLIEYLGLRFVQARAARNPETIAETPNKQDTEAAKGTVTLEYVGHHHHGNAANNKLSVGIMEAGILFHSILIGLTLVVAGDSFYRTLLIVIVFHQFFEGLALGARIALLPTKLVPWKIVMGAAFMLITPIGMAIGLGVLNRFNGNSPATVITFGTLDALSAGVLIWVGVVDMWARDWVLEGAEMLRSGVVKTIAAGIALVAGLILMGVLGKWA